MRRRLLRRLARDERGYAAILVAALSATIFMPLCALSVDISREYVEVQRVQNAADAAATAGVTFLPDNFAAAASTAATVASRNGYTNGSNGGYTTVSSAVGEKSTQLVVTVTTRIPNAFGAAFNANWATVSRSATADYNGPAPMGSPCNTFGNEPAGSVGNSDRGPSGSVISAPPGGAQCTSNPQFWAAIAGPDTPKGNGDEFSTRTCGKDNDGCSSSADGATNNEFDPLGYFYIVRVTDAAVGSPLTIQLYDPAWVENGDNCEQAPDDGTNLVNNMNPYTTVDGKTRYAETPYTINSAGARVPSASPNTFCTGDVLNGGTDPITTSYDLRQPTDTYQPANGVPITGCTKQYPGYLKNQVKAAALNSSGAGYKADLAKVYHQWVPLCTFTPDRAGDYYLQVRTDVALNTSSPDGQGGYQNNASVYSQAGDNSSVHGNGNNRFAIRVKGAPGPSVSVAGWQHMSIYANYSGANTTFNMVRVIPAAASKTLKIVFFDVGDAAAPGTIQILPPTDSNLGATLTGCRGTGVTNGTLPGCQLTNVSTNTGWNGRQQVVTVPIPTTYTCNASQPGGCWLRLQVSFPSGLNDTTTWSASIDGDPVRLIK